jgi:uncharacterized DUF497 family protein
MDFEWDETKRQTNLSKHGIDFIDACDVFDARPRLDRTSPRDDEARILSTARLGHRMVTVVWTERRQGVIRLISARRARDGEERAYRRIFG